MTRHIFAFALLLLVSACARTEVRETAAQSSPTFKMVEFDICGDGGWKRQGFATSDACLKDYEYRPVATEWFGKCSSADGWRSLGFTDLRQCLHASRPAAHGKSFVPARYRR